MCHVNITSPYGEISSPYFPGVHTEEATTCNWLIDRGDGYTITIRISGLVLDNNIDCKSNYIEVNRSTLNLSL